MPRSQIRFVAESEGSIMSEMVEQTFSGEYATPASLLDDISDIAQFYNGYVDGEQGRLEKHQLEYDLTWRYLDQYLPPHGTILEVGAATGRYTLELARRGYAVTAVDLSAALLERCRQNLAAAGFEQRVQFIVADARNLAEVKERRFSAVLLMGPLYHLIEEADRKRALKEAIDRVQVGGVIYSAFLNRFGMLADLIKRRPEWIEEQEHVRSFLERGRRPDEYPRGGFRGYSANPAEIAPLHEAMGLETLLLAAVEPVIAADDESYNRLQREQRRLWLDLLFQISRQESILGASRHLLYIGKKHKEMEI
jgi:SAM-dependent methyltransferase